MRDQFVGDVGDFGKYGLIRRLTGLTDPEKSDPALTLGVVWYYRDDELDPHSKHGKFVRYLCPTSKNKKEYKACDHDLWKELGKLVKPGHRRVHRVMQSPILPAGTKYFPNRLDFADTKQNEKPEQFRARWLQEAAQKVSGTDIVYLDPDDGLLPASAKLHTAKGCKYADKGDLQTFRERGQSVVLYQTQRGKSIKNRIADIRKLYPDAIAMWFHRGNARLFFILPQTKHRKTITDRIDRMLKTDWKNHFTKCP